jgi:hypothetical protein
MEFDPKIFTPADIVNYPIGTKFIVCSSNPELNTRDDVAAFYILQMLLRQERSPLIRFKLYDRYIAGFRRKENPFVQSLSLDCLVHETSLQWKSRTKNQICSKSIRMVPHLRDRKLDSTFIRYKAPDYWFLLPLEWKLRFLQWWFWIENSRLRSKLRLKDVEGKVVKSELVLQAETLQIEN